MKHTFTPPKSVIAIKPRCNAPLKDSRGVFKAYMQQVNSDETLDTTTTDTEHITNGLRFTLKQSAKTVAIGKFEVRF